LGYEKYNELMRRTAAAVTIIQYGGKTDKRERSLAEIRKTK